ncbi:MAG TPA: class E sortase [Candidatus Micrarchaeia archaeon]|nr:class E sortase [Candidatus Micrarchaeia archaeon]
MPRLLRPRLLSAALGVALVAAAAVLLLPPLLGIAHRGAADHRALQRWLGAKGAITKVVVAPPPSGATLVPGCGSGPSGADYALIQFPSLPGTEGVAASGTWSLLTQRSVVHWGASPAPGGVGNVLIALHREPNFETLGQLRPGDAIVLVNRACRHFTYRVTRTWVLDPSQVTQLAPVTGARVLTVITCTPLWIDTQRLVIRARLIPA